jgi:hypothetical protein
MINADQSLGLGSLGAVWWILIWSRGMAVAGRIMGKLGMRVERETVDPTASDPLSNAYASVFSGY